MSEIAITKTNYEAEVLKSEIPVLLDYWAVWCGPCKMIAPVVAELAQEYEGKVKVGKVNVDEEGLLAAQAHVSAIPTLILMKNGQEIGRSVGFTGKEELRRLIEG